MSVAPSHRLHVVETEIRELERARQALEQSLAQARRADERSAEHLAAIRKRIVDATQSCVPAADDSAIARRIIDAVTAVFTAAAKSLREHWMRVCELLRKALNRAVEGLNEKRRTQRLLEAELSRRG